MQPQPQREDFTNMEEYHMATQAWARQEILRRQRLNFGLNTGTDTGPGTFFYTGPTPMNGSTTLNQWRVRERSPFDEDEPEEEREEIDTSKLDKIMKERHLTKAERQALHKPKSDWIEGKKGEECRSACEIKIDDLVPDTLRVKRVVKQR